MKYILNSFFQHILLLISIVIVFRDWSLSVGARVVQLVNIGFAVVFTYKFGIETSGVDTASIYIGFRLIEQSWWWLIMPIIVLLQTIFLFVKSVKCDFLAGIVLFFSIPVWTFVSITLANSGISNTGTGVYAIWAFVCFWTGWRMVDYYYYRIIISRKGASDARSANNRGGVTGVSTSSRSDDRGTNGSSSPNPKQDKS